jgi:hypothetical protein
MGPRLSWHATAPQLACDRVVGTTTGGCPAVVGDVAVTVATGVALVVAVAGWVVGCAVVC